MDGSHPTINGMKEAVQCASNEPTTAHNLTVSTDSNVLINNRKGGQLQKQDPDCKKCLFLFLLCSAQFDCVKRFCFRDTFSQYSLG